MRAPQVVLEPDRTRFHGRSHASDLLGPRFSAQVPSAGAQSVVAEQRLGHAACLRGGPAQYGLCVSVALALAG